MAKLSESQKDARRRSILDGALRCFSRNGFQSTTTAEIARESGVSEGTLYLYFGAKDDIIVALSDDRRQGEALINALAQSEHDPIEGLSLLIELYGRSLADLRRTDARRVSIQGWAEALRNPVIKERVTASLSAVRQEIVRLIERGEAAGLIRPGVAPDAVARVLIAAFHGLTLQAQWGEEFDLAAVGRVLDDMLRGALSPEAALVTHPSRR